MTSDQLPQNVEAERATLAALLSDRDAPLVVASWLKSDHFYLPKHRSVFEAIMACHTKRIPTDLQTVNNELRRRGKDTEAGGVAGLVELSETLPWAGHVEYYARIVEETALRRELIAAGRDIAAMGYDEETPLIDLRSKAISLLTQTEASNVEQVTSHMDVLNNHEEALRQRQEQSTFKTGIFGIDQRVKLQQGRLITIAGPTGQGKSSLAECASERVARDGGQVLYWSGEMTADQMQDRRLARLAGISMDHLETGMLSEEEYRRYAESQQRIAAWPGAIHIYDQSATVANIRAAATKQKATTGLDMLVVDHIQILKRGPKQSLYDMVTQAATELKQLALDLRVTVLQLSQLSREFYKSADHRPQTWHMKESGEIENSSDAVVFLWFSEAAEAELRAMPGEVTHISMEIAANGSVEKNRWGKRGDFALSYVGGRYAFKG